MNINKMTCSLVFAAAILATTGCPDPNTAPLQPIGEIKGTISWDKGGERPNPSVVSDAIGITPVTVKLTPGTGPGSLGSTTTTKIKNENVDVAFGSPSDSGSRVTVTYTVSKLPLNTAIQLEVKPKHVQGTFIRDGNPQDAICTLTQLTVSQFDFRFVPAP